MPRPVVRSQILEAMKLLEHFVVVVAVAGLARCQGPYAASGWRPNGAQLILPGRGQPQRIPLQGQATFQQGQRAPYPAQQQSQAPYPANQQFQPGYPGNQQFQPGYPANQQVQQGYPSNQQLRPSYPAEQQPQAPYPAYEQPQASYPGPQQQQASFPSASTPQQYQQGARQTYGAPGQGPFVSSTAQAGSRSGLGRQRQREGAESRQQQYIVERERLEQVRYRENFAGEEDRRGSPSERQGQKQRVEATENDDDEESEAVPTDKVEANKKKAAEPQATPLASLPLAYLAPIQLAHYQPLLAQPAYAYTASAPLLSVWRK